MDKIFAVAALFALCACAGDAPTGPSIEWRCAGGASFSARMTSQGNAEVQAGGQTYRLAGVEAGSGTRYTDGQVEYWQHGEEAMLNGAAGGPYANCAATGGSEG